ncbi:MAG: hypothetical protein ACK5NK_14150 [Niabella sp.]
MFMLLILAWLTVSLPFAYQAKESAKQTTTANGKGLSNPLAGATEEKTPNLNFLEEYIHYSDVDFSLHSFQISVAYIHAHEAIYIGYHGEPPCPPPNSLS